MKKILFPLIALCFCLSGLQAQKYFTRQGKISFSSDTNMEKIEAQNNSATSIIDIENGKIEFAVLIKGFHFEKALMEEHFNENYMESGKYQKAIFKGKIINIEDVDFKNDSIYTTLVIGEMTMHGVTKPIETNGILTIKNGNINGAADFEIALADFKIKIPAIVKDNISKTVQVSAKMEYELFTK